MSFSSVEICAGAGGQAVGLESAGFNPVALIDNDPHSCATLRANRPTWRVLSTDLRDFVGSEHDGVLDVDLLSGGLPSAPYTVAGKQHGANDERDLLKVAIYLAMEVQPRAILLETTPTLLTSPKFSASRAFVMEELGDLGYAIEWKILDAQDFGVPQARRSSVLIAMRSSYFARFSWPQSQGRAPTVGEALQESMADRGWPMAAAWARLADRVAPTIVGGSKNHGGADLGPSRAKRQWLELGVDGSSLADDVPAPDFELRPELGRHGIPKITVQQAAILQGFPLNWRICGRKTAAYRQVAQAFPPLVAAALGRQIAFALLE
ncbi:DNA cytosine methyltransferase [Nonomuraea sp. NPDC001684]